MLKTVLMITPPPFAMLAAYKATQHSAGSPCCCLVDGHGDPPINLGADVSTLRFAAETSPYLLGRYEGEIEAYLAHSASLTSCK